MEVTKSHLTTTNYSLASLPWFWCGQRCIYSNGLHCRLNYDSVPSSTQWFRFFRVTMTGPNSNNHMYLCCSGFELYGSLFPLNIYNPQQPPHLLPASKTKDKDKDPLRFVPINTSDILAPSPDDAVAASAAAAAASSATVASTTSVGSSLGVREFSFVSDLDTNGILYALGSIGGTMEWKNPADRGLVRITASSLMEDSASANAVVGRDVVRCVTKPENNAFFIIDFVTNHITRAYFLLFLLLIRSRFCLFGVIL